MTGPEWVALVVLAVLAGCGGEGTGGDSGVRVWMDFGGDAGFYASPFPGEHRRQADGTADLAGFPNPGHGRFVTDLLSLLDGRARGFGASSAVFFTTTGAVDATNLPDVHRSVTAEAPVFLVDVDPGSSARGTRVPVDVAYRADGGPYGAEHLVSVLPLQGVPLRPMTLYAMVVLRSLGDAGGRPLAASRAVSAMARGESPPGRLGETALADYRTALDFLVGTGVDGREVAGLSVLRTGDPGEVLRALRDEVLAGALPVPLSPFAMTDAFDDFCVFQTVVEVPTFQQGTPPYSDGGGDILFDAAGRPVRQGVARSRVVVTVPRRAMPPAGFPAVVMIRTGGGGDRPLVDRGVRATAGGAAREPGSGPAIEFARAGWAGLSWDGPHGGLRNPTGGDEQFLMFNIVNPAAMRDNFQQSSLETIVMAHVAGTLVIDASACGGATNTRLDAAHLALFGHSMGATIAPPALALEPRYRAAILSGAGGSWVANIVWKESPVPTRPLAEAILRYPQIGRMLDEHDPVLSLLQWAGEPADPPLHGRDVQAHVLMFQGIVDTYILPPMANALSLSLGADLAGPARDEGHPELGHFRSLGDVLGLVDRTQVPLPVSANREGRTVVVVQHMEDGVEDGHEVVFQTAAPKRQYREFLSSALTGVPRVPE